MSKYRFFLSAFLSMVMMGEIFGIEQDKGIDEAAAKENYLAARKKCVQQQWTEAIALFRSHMDSFPGSKWQDDSEFWTGYCLEKTGKLLDAFRVFGELVSAYRTSQWADDALIHQINVAEKLFADGQTHFGSFLLERLKDQRPMVREHAALALGRLGDPAAVPILQDMQEDSSLQEIVGPLLARLKARTSVPVNASPMMPGTELNVTVSNRADANGEEGADGNGAGRDFLYIKTTKYRQYRSMLKKGSGWTEQELLDFGLWHILPTDKFEEYWQLSGYDRDEWRRKFWKNQDPTPTTAKNELFDEFLERVRFASTSFSELWDYKRSRFQKDQYLSDRWEHAPWDARGELYIKYGEPDFQVVTGYNEEEWHYYDINVDFRVRKYVTNIYGNAITVGPEAGFRYRDNENYIDANFIYRPEFHSKRIKNVKLRIDAEIPRGEEAIKLSYDVPAGEFEVQEGSKHEFEIVCRRSYVVLDEDLREVLREEKDLLYTDRTRQGLAGQMVSETLELSLIPGEYTVALRIADPATGNAGVFSQKVSVPDNTSNVPE